MRTAAGATPSEEAASAAGPPATSPRKSKSADEARARSLSRVRAMTSRERMIRALSLAEETEEILVLLGRARP